MTTPDTSLVLPEITLTAEQKALIDTLYDPYVKALPDGSIRITNIIGDTDVELYTVEPNGDYIFETLIALNNGWSKYDHNGKELSY